MQNENKLEKIAYKIFEILTKFHVTCILLVIAFILIVFLTTDGLTGNNKGVLYVGLAAGIYAILLMSYYGVILSLYLTGVKNLKTGKVKGARVKGLIGSILLLFPQLVILGGMLLSFPEKMMISNVLGFVNIAEVICNIVTSLLFLKNLLCRPV